VDINYAALTGRYEVYVNVTRGVAVGLDYIALSGHFINDFEQAVSLK
jgi:hypothetical protein